MALRHAVVCGGSGALGRSVVSTFKAAKWAVTSVDFRANDDASHNILLSSDMDFEATGRHVEAQVASIAASSKVDAIVNVAGGWAGGNLASEDLYKNTALMMSQSLNSSVITARLAALYLKDGGLLALVGASAATDATPGMVGYGLAKAAVHHLVKTAAAPGSGLPADAKAVAVLPITIDTPMNRKFNPDADYSAWTPVDTISQRFLDWATGAQPLTSGALYRVVTKGGNTDFVLV
ncbi:dihydropteridine reductase-like protein [Zopfochytrium polystomum]|nr:dihydropteridine reductase-like protein [Zopfochytrium polystomum]